jgi:hypothetical protein
MFSLLNPWILLSLILSLVGVYGYGHHNGYKEKTDEDLAVIAAKDQQMNEQKDKADVALNKAKQDLVTKNKQLNAAIDNGSLRLSIPISSSVGCSSSATGDGQERAELDRQTSKDLISITTEGDQAIIDLNSCIDRYNQVKEIISGNK